MSMVVKPLYWGDINYPATGAKIHIEDNVGDKLPIHVHMGEQDDHPWRVRLHFTYDQFRVVCEQMMEVGKWEK